MGRLVVRIAAACMYAWGLDRDRVQNVGYDIGGVQHSRFATTVKNYSSDVFCKLHILF